MKEKNKYEKYLKQEISKRVSFMNNTKWKYLFKRINMLNYAYVVQVKRLLNDKLEFFFIPKPQDFILYQGEEYIDNHTYSGVRLKEIEYIFISCKSTSKKVSEEYSLMPEINRLIECLKTGKQIEYNVSESGIYIYGYR